MGMLTKPATGLQQSDGSFPTVFKAALSRAWHRTKRWGEFLLRAMGVPVFPLAVLDLK